MQLTDVDLLALQTKFMQQDSTVQGMCAALTPQLRDLAAEVKNCLILTRIDELQEEILDELAYERHIEWYDATASIEVKRSLIKNSDMVHAYLGTPYAVEQVVRDYFGLATVKEWFEYGGEPFCFKVIVANQSVSGEQAKRFTKALDAVKNIRSRMDELVVGIPCSETLFCSESLIII